MSLEGIISIGLIFWSTNVAARAGRSIAWGFLALVIYRVSGSVLKLALGNAGLQLAYEAPFGLPGAILLVLRALIPAIPVVLLINWLRRKDDPEQREGPDGAGSIGGG